MDVEEVVRQAIEGLEKARKELETVRSWVYAHPEVWDEMSAEEFRDLVSEVTDLISEMRESLREMAQR